MEKEKKKVGRKSAYHEKVATRFDEIRSWRVNEGHTEIHIAKLLGIGYSTMQEYKDKFPEFAGLLKESKENLITELENTMFRLALGKVKVSKSKKIYVRNPRTGLMVLDKEEVNEDMLAPNPTMLIFSLKNLNPDKWKDRRDIDVNSNSDIEDAMKNFKLVSDELNKNASPETEDE